MADPKPPDPDNPTAPTSIETVLTDEDRAELEALRTDPDDEDEPA